MCDAFGLLGYSSVMVVSFASCVRSNTRMDARQSFLPLVRKESLTFC
jgi:hypothetical protein